MERHDKANDLMMHYANVLGSVMGDEDEFQRNAEDLDEDASADFGAPSLGRNSAGGRTVQSAFGTRPPGASWHAAGQRGSKSKRVNSLFNRYGLGETNVTQEQVRASLAQASGSRLSNLRKQSSATSINT